MGLSAHFSFALHEFMLLAEIVGQTVRGLGYELVDIETSPRARLVRVFIDKPATDAGADLTGSAVDVEDCARVSNLLTRVLMVENIDYDRLEVSSPGLDRVLKNEADFVRFTGQTARVKLRLPLSGSNQRNLTGVIVGCAEGVLRLNVASEILPLELANIERARLAPQF